MTIDEWKAIKRLARCTFRPGSYEKRFVNDMAALLSEDDWYSEDLTERQQWYLSKLLYKYRRQLASIPDPITGAIVPDAAKPGERPAPSEMPPETPPRPVQLSLFGD